MERNWENGYRTCSEDNVRQLRLIKLLRYIDFSLVEIRGLFALSEKDLSFALLEKKRVIANQQEQLGIKIDLLEQVVAALEKQEDWVGGMQLSKRKTVQPVLHSLFLVNLAAFNNEVICFGGVSVDRLKGFLVGFVEELLFS